MSKEKNKRFILTSRTNIIQKACAYSQRYRDYRLTKRAYIVNVGEYSYLTKARILYNHLQNSNVGAGEIANIVKNKAYKTIVEHRNFNPRLIHFITKQENFEDSQQEHYLEFIIESLDNPKEIWENCFTGQLDSSQRLLVQLVVANHGKIQESTLKNAYSKALVVMGIKTPEQERNDFENILENETDAFICTSCEEVAEEMEIFLEEIKDTYPFLKEDEIDSIRENIDLKSIVNRNFKFFESAKNSSCENKEQEDIKDVDALFSGLL